MDLYYKSFPILIEKTTLDLALARYNPRISAQELSNLPVEERTAIFYEIYPIKDKFIPAKQEAASL